MEPAQLLRVATRLLAVAALLGAAMAVLRYAADRRPPVWLSTLHGMLATSALTLLVYGWATVGLPRLATVATAMLLAAAAGGLVTAHAWRWKRLFSVETVLFVHLSIATLGLFLLLAASMGPGR